MSCIGFPGFLLLGAMGGLGFTELLVLFMVLFFVGSMAFWIWMLVDCAT